MLFQRVHRERPCRVGGGRQDICIPTNFDDVGRMSAARTFGMEGMYSAALQRGDRMFNKAALVQCIRVDHHLDVHVVGHR